jgi:sugar lactone lactonase YvrE
MCLALLLSLSSFNLFAGLKYVSPNGSNTNVGTEISPYLTISYAIQQAAEFDTVIMLPGNYNEQLTITKSLTLSSKGLIDVANMTNYVDNTILNGSGVSTQITFNTNNSKQLVLFGFTIKDCTSQVLNISSTNNSIIDRMKFINNGNIGNSVINIYGNVNVTNSYFKNNKFSNLIYIITAGNGFSSVNTCEFVENGLTNQFEKSLIYIYNKAKILNNVIYNNTGAMLNGGCNAPYDTVIVSNNTIVGNNGYGFVIDHCSGGINAFISNNIIEKNTKGCLHFVSNSSGYSTISLKNNKLNSNPYYTQNPIQYSLTWVNNDTSSVTAFTYPITNITQLNLPSYSTLIGKGLNSSLAELTKDFYNNNRPQPAGSNSDIGAIESSLSQPQISMVDSMSICKNNAPLDLISLVNPKTGQFSGNGVSGNVFYPDSVTSGVKKIYYTLSGANWSTTIDSILINVLPIPTFVVSPSVAPPYCIGTPVQLSATSVSNATYSWFQKDPVVANKVKTEVFSTHNGNGNQTQYAAYPTNSAAFDKFFDTTFSHTVKVFSGFLNETTGLNWSGYTNLSAQNVTVPNNGDYFSVQYSGMFTPAETGQYTFQFGSDDAAELMINNQVVLATYTSTGTNTINLVAGQQVTFRIRYQEFGGAEGFWISWKKPSQSTFQINTDEIESYGSSVLQASQIAQLSVLNPGKYYSSVILSNGCSVNSNVQTISFNSLPTITLSDFQPICNTQTTAVSLSGGLPTGGVYSGLGVSNNSLTPSSLPQGKTPLTYTYTDANGCVSSATKKINKLPGQITLSTTAACYNTPIIATLSDTSAYNVTWYNGNVKYKEILPSYKDTGIVVAGQGVQNVSFSAPEDLFIDAIGNQYIVEQGNHRVVRINTDGTTQIVAGGNGPGVNPNQLNNPVNVHVDANGNVFVVDLSNHRVMRWAPGATTGTIAAGSITGVSGSATNRLSSPVGLAFDSQGRMYVADFDNHRVMRYNSGFLTGTITGTPVAGNGTAGALLNQLNAPRRLFIDALNNLYVGDDGNARVLKFPANSTSGTSGVKVAGGNGHGGQLRQINNPISDIYADASGNVYLSDYSNERIVRWQPGSIQGELIVGGNGYGWNLNQVSRPTGLHMTSKGDIFVLQRDHARLLKFSINNLYKDTITPLNPGAYTVKFENKQIGCPITSSVITINKPIVSLTSSAGDYVCNGSPTTLTTNANAAYTYQWKKNNTTISGATSNSYVASQAGTYKVIVGDANGCYDSPATFTINPLPTVAITSSGNCATDSLFTSLPDSSVSRIDWYNNGNLIKSKNTSYNTDAEIIMNSGMSNGLGLNWPMDVVVDRLGNYYYSEYANHRVIRVSPDGLHVDIVAGGSGAGTGLNQLNGPIGITIDKDFNLYIADSENHRIVKWSQNASAGTLVAGVSGSLGTTTSRLNLPFDVELDEQGSVFIADYNNHRVLKWTIGQLSGVVITGNGTAGNAMNQLNKPTSLDYSNGSLYIADQQNGRVLKVQNQQITKVAGFYGGNPEISNVCVDLLGNIYTSEFVNSRIIRWAPNSTQGEIIAGGNGNGPGLNQLGGQIYGLTFDNDFNLIVCDPIWNQRILKYSRIPMSKDTIVALNAGSYTAKNVTIYGCENSSTAITINKPNVSLTSSAGAYVCDGSPTTLTTNANAAYTYQWKRNNTTIAGATTNSYVASQAGTYKVIVGDANGCYDSPATFTINPLPTVAISSTGNCLGDTLITNVPDSTIAQVTWYKDGQVVKTGLPEFNSIGECIANNSQGYGWSGDVHLDKDGQVYFSDGDNHRVLRFNPTDNTYTIVAGGNGQGSALNQLNVPYGIYVDGLKNVFVADYNNHRIVRWAQGATAGVIVAGNGTQGSGLSQLNGPTDVLVDSQNRVFVADLNNHRVTRWTTSSVGVIVAGQGGGGSGLNQLNNPYNLFMTEDNELYITDHSNHRVVKYLPNATSGVIVAGGNNGNGNTALNQLHGPVGIFVDNKKNIYVSEYSNNRVTRWKNNATTGELVVGGTGGGHLLNQTTNPRGVFLNNKEIYVTTSNYANRVMKFTANDILSDSLQVTSPGTYKAEFTSYSRCSASSPNTIIYNPISSMTSSAGAYVCDGSPTTLTTNANAAYTYQWKRNNTTIAGATTNSYVASQVGTYKVIVSDTNGCADSPLTFTINPLPVVSLTSTGNCLGDTLITNVPDSTIAQVTWYKDGQVVNTTLPKFNPTGEIVAGNGLGGLNINWTSDIYVDDEGNQYFSEPENHRVIKYNNETATFQIVAGGNGAGNALNQLNNPYGIHVDQNKTVYVADYSNQRVVKWLVGATQGIVIAGTGVQGNASSQLNGPIDVALDSQNRLYVAEHNGGRVTRWLTPNSGTVFAGINYAPYLIYMTENDNLYVTDWNSHRILKYNTNGSSGVVVAGGNNGNGNTGLDQLLNPMAIFVDNLENIYISDHTNNRVVRWKKDASTGELIAGGTGTGNGLNQTSSPRGVFVKGNKLYVAGGSNRVMKFSTLPMTADSLQVTSPGTYKAEFTTYSRCSDFDTIVPMPRVFTQDTVIVQSSDTTFVINPSNYAQVSWSTGSTSHNYTISQTGLYTVTLSNPPSNCQVQDRIFVYLGKSKMSITDTTLCEGLTLKVSADRSNLNATSPLLLNYVAVGGHNGGIQSLSSDSLRIWGNHDGLPAYAIMGNSQVKYGEVSALTYIVPSNQNTNAPSIAIGMNMVPGDASFLYSNSYDAAKGLIFRIQQNVVTLERGIKFGSFTPQVLVSKPMVGLNLTTAHLLKIRLDHDDTVRCYLNNQLVIKYGTKTLGLTAGYFGFTGPNAQYVFKNVALKKYNSSILWSNGATDFDINVTVQDTMQLSYVITDGPFTLTDIVTITGIPIPNFTISTQDATSICTGGSALLEADSIPGANYIWKKGTISPTSTLAVLPGQNGMSYIANTGGTYYSYFVTAQGCQVLSNPITISELSPNVSLANFAPVCSSNASSFTLSGGLPLGGTYKINGVSATNFDPSLVANGIHQITYTIINNAFSACQNTVTKTIAVLPMAVQLTSIDSCSGSNLIASVLDNAPYGITWLKDNVVIKNQQPKYDTIGNLPFASVSNLSLNAPKDLFIGSNGDYYISDGNNHRVIKINPITNLFTVVAGGNGAGTGLNQLNQPMGIFVDNSGAVYVADQYNHRIMKWTSGATTGSIVAGTGSWGANLTLLHYPSDVWVNSSNQIYVVDQHNHRVVRWDQNATTGVLVAGNGVAGSGLNQLHYPISIFMNAVNEMYIADYHNHRILRFNIGNTVGTLVAGGSIGNNLNQLNYPYNMIVDAQKNIYVSDLNNNRIVRWSQNQASGELVAGGKGYGWDLHQTPQPTAVGLDAFGNLKVLTHDHARVLNFKIKPQNADTIQPSLSGNYQAVFTNTQIGCPSTSNTIIINKPVVKLISSNGDNTCFGDTTLLSTINNPQYSYQWTKDTTLLSASTNSVSVSTPGVYTVTAIDNFGCKTTSENYVILDSVLTNIVSTNHCVGSVLTSNNPDSIVQVINWYKNNQLIKQVLPDYEHNGLILAGSGLTFNGLNLNGAQDVTIDKEGSMYISDHSNHRVIKMNKSRTSWEVVAGGSGAGSGLTQLYYPMGIFVDDNFDLYIADRDNHRVVKWAKNATSGVIVAGTSGASGVSLDRLSSPSDVLVDISGNIYVTDMYNHRVVKWAANATAGVIVAGTNQAGSGLNQLHNPKGIVLKNNELFVADYDNHRIMKFVPNSLNGVIVLGGNGAGNYLDQVSYPFELVIDNNNNFYVSEYHNHRIVRWQQNAQQGKMLIGNGQSSATLNQLSHPTGLHLSKNGTITVADYNNSRVIEFEAYKLQTDSIQAFGNGNYKLEYKTYFGCQTNSSDFIINGPQFNLISSNGFNLCFGDTTLLTRTSNQTYTYQWLFNGVNLGLNLDTLTAFNVGKYQLKAIDQSNCQFSSQPVFINSSSSIQLANTTNCIGSILTPSITDTVYQISWYLNGNLKNRVIGNYDSLGYVIAGNNVGGVNIHNAMDVFIDKDGDYYMSDYSNHRVIRVAADGNTWNVVAGGYGNGNWSNQLSSPMGVFVDNNKNVYVADRDNHRVMKWAPGATTGVIVAGSNGITGSALNRLNNPIDVVVDHLGAIYISDRDNHRVVKWNNGATSGTIVAGNGIAGNSLNQLSSPHGISLDNHGRMYIADYNNNRIVKYDNGSSTGVLVAGGNGVGASLNQVSQPIWITADDFENVYVSDHQNYRSVRFKKGSVTGQVVAAGNGPGAALNQLQNPSGISLDNVGNLYVIDGNWQNNRLLKYSVKNAINTPLTADSAGYYTVSTSNTIGCESNSNGVQIYDPIISYPNFNSVCIANPNFILNSATPSGGTYLGTGVVNNSFNPSIAGVGSHNISYIYTDIHGCQKTTVKPLVVDSLPNVNLSVIGNLTHCNGDSVIIKVLNNNAVQNYSWFKNGVQVTNTTNQIKLKEPTSTTIYAQVTRNSCVASTNVLNITVNPLPIVSAGPNKTICFGDTVNLVTSGQLSYNWSKLNQPLVSLSATNVANVSPLTTTSYLLKGTNSNGCVNKDTVIVNVNSLPLVSAGIDQVICFGDSVLLNGLGATSYVWNQNVVNAVKFKPGQTSNYTVIGTDLNGCKNSDSVQVLVNALPNVFAGNNDSICFGSSYILNATGASSYTWNNSILNNISFTPTLTNTYIVTGTDLNGCVKKDTVLLKVLSLPIVSAGPNKTICFGDTVNLVTTGQLSYNWSKLNQPLVSLSATNVANVSPLTTTSYLLKGTNSNGCVNKDTVIVNVNSLPLVSAGIDQVICFGDSVLLNGLGATSYVWNQNVVNAVKFKPGQTSNYTVIGTDLNGCKNSDSVQVLVNALPNVFAGNNDSICFGSSYILNATGASSYTWNNSILNNISFTPTLTNTYIVTGTDLNGCVKKDTVLLKVLSLPSVAISNSDSTTFCMGDSINLIASGSANVSYQWLQNNSNISQFNDSLIVLNSGAYKVKATYLNGCNAISNVINVVVHQYPIANITVSSPLVFCDGESVVMNANTGSLLTYQWKKNSVLIPNQQLASLVVSDSGSYQLIATYDGLCSTTSTASNVTVNPLPIATNNYQGVSEVCAGDTVYFTANAGSLLNYQWYNSNGNMLVNQTQQNMNTTIPGSYYVEVENQFGCVKNSDTLSALNYLLPQTYQEICAVSVDTSTNSNKIIWEKPVGAYRVWYYNIYRETAISGQYGLVGTVLDTALTVYNDVLSNPAVQSYRYKISHVDSCGIESGKSSLHRTIHLSSNMGINGVVNLSWNQYEGFNYPTHDILRSVNGSPFISIAQISSNSSTYTDLNPPVGLVNYIIGIDIPNGCSPNKSSSTSLLSNKISVGTASVENYLTSQMEIYPNPSDGLFTLKISDLISNEKKEFEIINSIGQIMYSIEIVNKLETKINLQEFSNGVYFIRHKNGNWMEKFIINK